MELLNLSKVLKYMESWEELQGSKGLRSSVLIPALLLLLCDLQETSPLGPQFSSL